MTEVVSVRQAEEADQIEKRLAKRLSALALPLRVEYYRRRDGARTVLAVYFEVRSNVESLRESQRKAAETRTSRLKVGVVGTAIAGLVWLATAILGLGFGWPKWGFWLYVFGAALDFALGAISEKFETIERRLVENELRSVQRQWLSATGSVQTLGDFWTFAEGLSGYPRMHDEAYGLAFARFTEALFDSVARLESTA